MTHFRWFMLLLCLTVGSTACLAADVPTAPPPVTPAPAPKVVEKINPKDGASMVWIPAGEFLMGSPDTAENVNENEKPQHKVYLDGYWMYKNDVTVAQYRKFCAATGRELPKLPDWSKDDHPIVMVSWDDATAYATWAGAALPTEAQWEKAARGTDGRIYPWGNTWDATKCCNCVGKNDPGQTNPVGSYPSGASPYGCLDMAGNVWQWCADWYDENYYQNSPSRNPTGPDKGVARVLRGGRWLLQNAGFYRAANRYYFDFDYRGRFNDFGFRCVSHSPAP